MVRLLVHDLSPALSSGVIWGIYRVCQGGTIGSVFDHGRALARVLCSIASADLGGGWV